MWKATTHINVTPGKLWPYKRCYLVPGEGEPKCICVCVHICSHSRTRTIAAFLWRLLLSWRRQMFILPVQVNPSPVYPGRQVHVKLPTLLVQLASALQPPLFVSHSSISALLQIFHCPLISAWYYPLVSNTQMSLLPSSVGLNQLYQLVQFHTKPVSGVTRALYNGIYLLPIYHLSIFRNIIIVSEPSSLIMQICPNWFHFLAITAVPDSFLIHFGSLPRYL